MAARLQTSAERGLRRGRSQGEALPREAFCAGVGSARRPGRERGDDGESDLASAAAVHDRPEFARGAAGVLQQGCPRRMVGLARRDGCSGFADVLDSRNCHAELFNASDVQYYQASRPRGDRPSASEATTREWWAPDPRSNAKPYERRALARRRPPALAREEGFQRAWRCLAV